MRIIGIDPGLGITGYGVIELKNSHIKLIEAGIIKTSHFIPIHIRLKNIYVELEKLLSEFKPGVLVLEDLYSHYKHPRTSILMAHVRGVACLISCLKDIQVVGFPAKRIKKAITGNGNASKEQIEKMITNILRLKEPITQPDVADALALAIGYVYMNSSGQRTEDR
ncbi:MAG: crossover junction endodeoxyribonuclease RuvC [Candidatus Omnitrophica bacterium]|nr:crossover junction endodeoxyribonuclease RuvC [Candidatus Omnitrophota bacterium]